MRKKDLGIKETAFDYYCKGLTATEIGTLTGISFRTIQNYMSAEQWKQRRTDRHDKEKELARKQVLRGYVKSTKQ